ncbi:MAG TPA: hypothetical protein K8V84_06810 [Nocardiopsis listeri]|uniref:hypothetical protein n=1 Tax=Nocardiopsis listeri TaxID=53440 RepID=UPI001D1FA872|nr:hypothetical protein [Nocardiopsis listeri]HJE58212.1 hypothetical protein [Nocardiopsis listeri]
MFDAVGGDGPTRDQRREEATRKHRWGRVRRNLFLSGPFLVMFVLPLLISPYLKFRHNRILLTDQVLKVGRNAVPLERLAVETAAPDRGPRTLDRIRYRPLLNHRPDTPMGYTPVALYTRDGDPVAVDSREPDKLVRALRSLTPR